MPNAFPNQLLYIPNPRLSNHVILIIIAVQISLASLDDFKSVS